MVLDGRLGGAAWTRSSTWRWHVGLPVAPRMRVPTSASLVDVVLFLPAGGGRYRSHFLIFFMPARASLSRVAGWRLGGRALFLCAATSRVLCVGAGAPMAGATAADVKADCTAAWSGCLLRFCLAYFYVDFICLSCLLPRRVAFALDSFCYVRGRLLHGHAQPRPSPVFFFSTPAPRRSARSGAHAGHPRSGRNGLAPPHRRCAARAAQSRASARRRPPPRDRRRRPLRPTPPPPRRGGWRRGARRRRPPPPRWTWR